MVIEIIDKQPVNPSLEDLMKLTETGMKSTDN